MTDTLERREAEQRLRNMLLTIAIAANEAPASDAIDDLASMVERIVQKLANAEKDIAATTATLNRLSGEG